MPDSDTILVRRIREGADDSWEELIARYEGRLLAFVESRIGDRTSSEDVVQETFIGFLTSLPNFDDTRPLEGYLFSIASYKLTDFLRKRGRRPALPLSAGTSTGQSSWQIAGSARPASSIVRSGERRGLEENALAATLRQLTDRYKERGEWSKLYCVELLFVRGIGNKQAAEQLDITQQDVANIKFDFLARMRKAIKAQGLPEEVFPEMQEDS
jgi:RNA polymerase sigma-70 factor (ECF subfamily)